MPSEISPRDDEVDAILEVLTDTTYEGPRDMAIALLKTAYQHFRQRDWYAFGVLYKGKPYQVYGLEPTELAAWKAAEDLSYRDKAVWPILSYDKWLEDREEAINDAEFVPNPDCVKCGHQEYAHHFVDWQGKRTFPKKAESAPKCSADCDCTGFLSEAMRDREAELEAQNQKRRERVAALAAKKAEEKAARAAKKGKAA